MQTRTPEQNAQLMAEWEAKLKKEGLDSEPAPDKGKKALQELVESQTGEKVSDDALLQAMQEYWLTRGDVGFRDHMVTAHELENRFGLLPGTVDDAMMVQVEDQMAHISKEAFFLASEIKKSPMAFAKGDVYVKNRLRHQLKTKFPELSDSILEILIDNQVS